MAEVTESKKPWLSKTLIFNFIVAAAAFWEPARAWVAGNEAVIMSAFAVVNMILRMVTKDKIGLS